MKRFLICLAGVLLLPLASEACGGGGAGRARHVLGHLFHRHHRASFVAVASCVQAPAVAPAGPMPLPMPQAAPPQAPKPATKTTTTTTVVEEVPVAPPVARVGYAASVIVAAPVYVRAAPIATTTVRTRTFSRTSSGDVGPVRALLGLPFGVMYR